MAGLTMSATAEEPAVVTQQSILLRVAIRNGGTAPQLVPNPQGETEYSYRISGVEPGLPRMEVSAQTMREALTEGTPEPEQPSPAVNLGAGLRSQRVDDVLRLANRPLPPGPYQIAPAWRVNGETLEGPAVQVNIEAPRPAAVSTAICKFAGKRMLAMVQPVAGGRHSLLAQKLEPGIKDLARLESIAARGGAAGSVATSVQTEEVGSSHWTAWLNGSSLVARLHPSLRAPAAQPELPVEGRDPHLLTPGFTTGDGAGIFLVLVNEGQAPGLLAYRFEEEGSRLLWRLGKLMDRMPERVLVRYLDYGRQGGAVQLITAVGPPPARIMSHTILLETGKPVAAPELLHTAETPILAMDVAPVGTKQGAQISVVTAPAHGGTAMLSRVRVPAAKTGPKPEVVRLPPLLTQPPGWAVLGVRAGSAAAASDGKRLFAFLPGENRWRVKENVNQAQYLRLTSVDGVTVWLEWLDPAFGFRVEKLK